MSQTYADRLTARFYQWEQLGRGWHAFDEWVELEPPFTPFFGHCVESPLASDDSKRHTWISKAVSYFQKKQPPQGLNDNDFPPITPYLFEHDAPLIRFSLSMPKGIKVDAEAMQQVLLMLSDTIFPVSFEIVGIAEGIAVQIVCREPDAAHVRNQLEAYYPDLRITAGDTAAISDTHSGGFVLEFGIADEFMLPMRTYGKGDSDPYIGLLAAMEHLGTEEGVMVQILFQGACNPWGESILRAASDNEGKSFFSNAPDFLKQAAEKISAPLFAVCIRVMAATDTEENAKRIAEQIGISVQRISASGKNQLIGLHSDLDQNALCEDIFLRRSHRLGMLLNSYELANFAHIPSESIATQKLLRDTRKTKRMPEIAAGHSVCLGVNTHAGVAEVATVPTSLRLRHMHIIGATGTGKSTLLISLIAQDMELGNGCAVLDPHGDLIESILQYVPENRLDDVILIDPADGDYPIAFNILNAHSDIEKEILASDLVAAFRRLSLSWGDQMNSVLANAILAFLESTEGGTLIDLRRFLVEKLYREQFLKTVQDANVVYYWQREYPLLKGGSIGSILTRLDAFLRPKVIRNMVAQKKGLDFEQILDGKKILLVKLSQGLIGAENSYLLGTFFVSKMYQAAMARQAKAKTDRSDYFLYIDEFQNFITPSMSHILSGARKYHLGLILAHQDMQQLQKHDSELASSVVVNAATRVCFRLGDIDAKRFASGFSFFDATDLENLKTGEAIVRMEQPTGDFNLSTVPLPDVSEDEAKAKQEKIVVHTRSQYGTPKATVEESLAHLKIQPTVPEEEKPKPPKKEPQPTPATEQSESISQPAATAPPQVDMLEQVRAKKAETQHRYWQMFIKRMAESRGYTAVIEAGIPHGNGRVDVSLEKNGKRIACEISVTTTKAWEAHNVEKCLAAGYDEVIVCSNDSKHLAKIQDELRQKLSAELLPKIHILETDAIARYFDSEVVENAPKEKIIKGYRVKVRYDNTTEDK